MIQYWELLKENKQLKEVIDKAIEYNKKNIHSQTLYKILKEELCQRIPPVKLLFK